MLVFPDRESRISHYGIKIRFTDSVTNIVKSISHQIKKDDTPRMPIVSKKGTSYLAQRQQYEK